MAAFRARLAKERQAKPAPSYGDKMLEQLKAQVELKRKAEKERIRQLEQTKSRDRGHGRG